MKLIVASLALALSMAGASALVPVQPTVQVNPRHTFSEWAAILDSQTIVPERCDRCQMGSRHQPDVAGRVAVADTRIIGGDVAQPGQFPWQAQVRMDDSFFCGGSVISDEWILTAGHCGKGFRQFTIVLGSFYSQNEDEPNRLTISTTEARVHEEYNPRTISNDISVIRLPNKIPQWTDFIRPVRLPSGSQALSAFAGEPATLSGWGRYGGNSSVSPSISPVLRYVNVNTIANTECAQYFGPAIRSTNICTSGAGPRGACNGDSGGALTLAGQTGAAIQLGIVSFGTSLGCNKQFPSAYTRVPSYLKWISDKTDIAIES